MRKHSAEWAGYDSHGNDRNGHMHFHESGSFIRSDGKCGFYCAAPSYFDSTDGQYYCTDPQPNYLDAIGETS